MKHAFLLVIAICTLCRAAEPFAPTNRIVTMTQYHGGTGVRWIVWAVLPSKIVAYEVSGSTGVLPKPHGEFALSSEQLARIRAAVVRVPKSARGMFWYSPDVMDGVSLAVQFSPDGEDRDDDILIENVWRSEVQDLYAAVSACLPREKRITYKEIIDGRRDQNLLAISVRPLKEYRAEQRGETKPWWKFWK